MFERMIDALEAILRALAGPTTTRPVLIPGIGTGSAYADGDAFGLLGEIAVPRRGTINTAVFYDLDDEGIAKDLVLFSSQVAETADNAAFTPGDADLAACVGVVSFRAGDFANWGANQVGTLANVGLSYEAPAGKLWFQWVTRGADNIAAGALPRFSLSII